MSKKLASADRMIARIAARQHGVVATRQFRAVGVNDAAINYRLGVGRLHRVHRGVYAVGHAQLSFEGRCLAAALACGEGAAVSHRSAAVLWGMLGTSPGRLRPDRLRGRIDVTVPGGGGRAQRSGIWIHRSLTLSDTVTTRHRAVPVTTPARTLIDLRRVAPRGVFQPALRRATDLRLVDPDDLHPDPDLTRSELERMFLRLCRRRRLPAPEVNARVAGHEVDFLWRDRRLIVETDGYRHHASRAAFEADRARDAHLQSLGYRVLRFTYRQVRESPEQVASALRRLIRSEQLRLGGS